MQQDPIPSDGEQQEPNWVLASYGQRAGAWALDFVGFALPLIFLIVILLLGFVFASELVQDIFSTSETVQHSMTTPTSGRIITWETTTERVEWPGAATAISILAVGIPSIVVIGYIIWWLFALRRGQTPGKRIVGIRVVKDNGEPSGWGYTFLREFVIKFLLLGLISEPTLGIARLVDYLWPLWDRAEKMQTLHDKLLGTLVVRV